MLGLNFDTWFVSPEKCSQLLSHWKDRGDWFNVSPKDDLDLIEISTSAKHSIASITISHGTMQKATGADGKNARIYSFIPSPNASKSPYKFDAFLEPC